MEGNTTKSYSKSSKDSSSEFVLETYIRNMVLKMYTVGMYRIDVYPGYVSEYLSDNQ